MGESRERHAFSSLNKFIPAYEQLCGALGRVTQDEKGTRPLFSALSAAVEEAMGRDELGQNSSCLMERLSGFLAHSFPPFFPRESKGFRAVVSCNRHDAPMNQRRKRPCPFAPPAAVKARASLSVLAYLSLATCPACANFVYPSFNSTMGLSFVGAAATSSCVNKTSLQYGAEQGDADTFNQPVPAVVAETVGMWSLRETETNPLEAPNTPGQAQRSFIAGFGNREEAAASPDARHDFCPVRVRLTPSAPSKAGALWFSDAMGVATGFETIFVFQVTDQSRVCTTHRDAAFSVARHRTCSARGGDGLAFVIHSGDPRGNAAIGESGGQLGYGGISGALAVEFDTWYNAPGAGANDPPVDHVAVHSLGPRSNASALADAELSAARPISGNGLADGRHHAVKIAYQPRLATEYFFSFTATPSASRFMVDGGENRRIGTLIVWLDEGIASDQPLLALPIQLGAALDLDDDSAFVGFTAATGAAWAKHDVLSWVFCEEGNGRCDGTDELKVFDYHEADGIFRNAELRDNSQGNGYGAGDMSTRRDAPTKQMSPDTSRKGPLPAYEPYVAVGSGASVVSGGQVPPFVQNRR